MMLTRESRIIGAPRIDPLLSNHRSGVMHGVPPSPEGCLVPFCLVTVFILLLPVTSLHIRADVSLSLIIHSTFAFFLYNNM
jgi:hypothetical protein